MYIGDRGNDIYRLVVHLYFSWDTSKGRFPLTSIRSVNPVSCLLLGGSSIASYSMFTVCIFIFVGLWLPNILIRSNPMLRENMHK